MLINIQKNVKKFANMQTNSTFVPTVPVVHTIRTAGGSFLFYGYGK